MRLLKKRAQDGRRVSVEEREICIWQAQEPTRGMRAVRRRQEGTRRVRRRRDGQQQRVATWVLAEDIRNIHHAQAAVHAESQVNSTTLVRHFTEAPAQKRTKIPLVISILL